MSLESRFIEIIQSLKIDPKLLEVINYSLFPAGKLFRPKLCLAIANDLGIENESLDKLALALEVHHTYTLIHDDLPCMDDDTTRRGRNSLHVEFNEWKALLAGDALLNLSYELLSSLEISNLGYLIKTFSSYTGANGLILGQYLDLSAEDKSYEETIQLHKLKTSRLIQLSVISPLIIANKPTNLFDEFGEKLGLYFQIQDDLSELTPELKEDSHEQNINIFLNFDKQRSLDLYLELKSDIKKFIQENNLHETSKIFESYQMKMDKILIKNKEFLKKKYLISLD